MNKREVGSYYEDAAVKYLQKNGVQVIEKNFRCRSGEIDIIGLDGECLVFFEVKYRRNDTCGQPQEAVTIKKQKTICRCAAIFCSRHTEYRNIRYDVIAVLGNQVVWYQNAFFHQGYLFY